MIGRWVRLNTGLRKGEIGKVVDTNTFNQKVFGICVNFHGERVWYRQVKLDFAPEELNNESLETVKLYFEL